MKGNNINKIEIYNVYGAIIKIMKIENAQNVINIYNQPKGVYLFKITTSKGVIAKKIMVK
ncbi:MAG: hypothetical protein B6I20_09390 [Bacteroidetes bacterium 4572_117]|nr:MAG: hypothetical protein B6I20_09390 [Bacteroidetes bacterium 4572_117]